MAHAVAKLIAKGNVDLEAAAKARSDLEEAENPGGVAEVEESGWYSYFLAADGSAWNSYFILLCITAVIILVIMLAGIVHWIFQ